MKTTWNEGQCKQCGQIKLVKVNPSESTRDFQVAYCKSCEKKRDALNQAAKSDPYVRAVRAPLTEYKS